MTKTGRHRIATTLALALSGVAASSAETMKAEEAIEARQAVMRVMSLNFEPLGAMVKGDMPFDTALFKANAERMAAVSAMPLKDYFVDGTDIDAGVAETEALPEIWLDWENFERKLEAMREAVTKLAAAARSGDRGEMKSQVGATGKACKSCHDDFRS